jgi:hypothetical protein
MASKLNTRKRRHSPSPTARAMITQCRDTLQRLLETEEGGRRVISPRTEQEIQELLRRLDDQIETPDFQNETKLAQEMRGEVSRINDLRTDKAYESAVRKLEDLMEVQFYRRYAPYLVIYASHLEKAARDLKDNNDSIISTPKSAIDETNSNIDEPKPASDELKPAPLATNKEAGQHEAKRARRKYFLEQRRAQSEPPPGLSREDLEDPFDKD